MNHEEKPARTGPGMAHLALSILLYASVVALIAAAIAMDDIPGDEIPPVSIALLLTSPFVALLAVLDTIGLTIVRPREGCVLVFFGKYNGTIKENGFFWVNPFNKKQRISLRSRNLNGERLKVNDKAGNPIEIAAVLVWKVDDTYAASFDVDDYDDYVTVQSESALRHLATSYPYDSWDDEGETTITLRANIEEVSAALETELQERLGKAGVRIEEARLSHLAYAPEIAQAMLQRQQAAAIVSARQKIVDGAVGMVEMAIAKIAEGKIVELDDERKATMVSNLLVVLCGESSAQPVINAGTLYR